MPRRLLALTALAMAPAAPALAAPTLTPLKPCYVTVQTSAETYESEPVTVSGSGFAPGASLTLKVDDEIRDSSLVARDDGSLPPVFTDSPFALHGERDFVVSVTDNADPAQSVALGALASPLKVSVTPRRAAPREVVRFRGRGFTEDAGVYAHYIRRGKLRRTVRLAKATQGECGRFDVSAPQFPFMPKRGIWRVQIDQHRRLSGAGPLINLTIDVRLRAPTAS